MNRVANYVSEDSIVAAAKATHDETKALVEQVLLRVAQDFQAEIEQLRTEIQESLAAMQKANEEKLEIIKTLLSSLPSVSVEPTQVPVVVNVPPPRLVEKSFRYDEHGRPLNVTEKEIPEFEVK